MVLNVFSLYKVLEGIIVVLWCVVIVVNLNIGIMWRWFRMEIFIDFEFLFYILIFIILYIYRNMFGLYNCLVSNFVGIFEVVVIIVDV